MFGYGLSALTKPLFALASNLELVVTARLLDRVGKGLRGAPRDALVADLTPPEMRGAAFGLRQSLDTVGAFLGPVLAVALMLLWAGDFRAIFWVAVVPGLMDMHTHLMSQHSKEAYTEKFFMEDSEYALRSTVYARLTLLAGFTTVRELGDNGVNSVALRRAIREGWIIGPRIYTAGKSLATTGGHADPSNGQKGRFREDPGPVDGVINGPDEARKAVRQRYKDGADLIKLTATGGVLSLAASGQNPQFTTAELQAIVETAKDYGMTVAVHAHGAEGMKQIGRAHV